MEIEAEASPSDIRLVLKNVPGIEKIDIKENGEETSTAFIYEKKGEDVRLSVFRAFASAGIPLLTLKASGTTLEDVFMELTQSDTVPEALAKKGGWVEVQTADSKSNSQEQGEEVQENAGDL